MRIRFVRCMVVAFAAAIFSSCEMPRIKGELNVYQIDSCEYVVSKSGYILHKANCKNHKNKKHCVFCHSNIE
jgi:hypothetical protein